MYVAQRTCLGIELMRRYFTQLKYTGFYRRIKKNSFVPLKSDIIHTHTHSHTHTLSHTHTHTHTHLYYFSSSLSISSFPVSIYSVAPNLWISPLLYYSHIYIHTCISPLAKWVKCSPMARETGVQIRIGTYQQLKKWYLWPLCLTHSIIR